MYFRAYMLTGDAKWAELGAAELPGLAQVAVETDSHKLSHLFDSSFGEALLAAAPGAPLDEYRHVMQTAAAALVQRCVSGSGACLACCTAVAVRCPQRLPARTPLRLLPSPALSGIARKCAPCSPGATRTTATSRS